MPEAADTATELASIAHRLWCAAMRQCGWRHGSRYDAGRKLHDALVPFEQLDPDTRHDLCQAVEHEELSQRLIELVRHDRGPARVLRAGEMRAGARVALADDEPEAGGTAPARQGTIMEWEVDPREGVLQLVRVRWDSGEVTEHFPPECELRRVGDWPER